LFDRREQDEIIKAAKHKHNVPEYTEAVVEIFVDRAVRAFSKKLRYDITIVKKKVRILCFS
jgi:hypothetical protein